MIRSFGLAVLGTSFGQSPCENDAIPQRRRDATARGRRRHSPRGDYRRRLACLYLHWRSLLMEELASPRGRGRRPSTSARTRASLFQAVAHGLAVQLVADPRAFDRDEMMRLCRRLFAIVAGPARPR